MTRIPSLRRTGRLRALPLLGIVLAIGLGVAACQPSQAGSTAVLTIPVVNRTATPSAAPSATPEPTDLPPTATATPSPVPTPTRVPRILTVCLEEEPQSLYIYAEPDQAWRHVQEALRDGPVDHRSYGNQPVILQKLPHWEDGDVRVQPVTVAPGAAVVNTAGELKRLAEGLRYWTPDLAEAVAEPDKPITTIQMVVTFRLRPDVRWSDGELLTAADSVFGFEVLRSEDTPKPNKYVVERTASYVATDARTAVWTGVPGFLDREYYLRFAEPLPVHAYSHLTPAELNADEQVNRRPLGWGAFQVSEWAAGSHLRLVRNEHYFRAAEGLPYLDEVRFIFVTEAAAVLDRLASGECQVAVRNVWGAWEAQAEDLLQLEAEGRVAPQFVLGPILEHLDFGIMPAEGYEREVGAEFFKPAAVRQAIAYCIDREAVAAAAQWGRGVVANSYVPGNHPLYAGDRLYAYPFDPERGRALLAEAGWTDGNGDGIRDRAGISLVLNYAVNYPDTYTGQLRQTIAELIQSDLREACGIEVNIEPLSGVEMYADWPVAVVFGRQFDLAQFAWWLPGGPACSLYLSDEIPRDEFVQGQNDTGYSRSEFDSACKLANEARERAKATSAHLRAQEIFTADLPSLPLFFRLRIGVARSEVRGFQLDPTHLSPLWNIEAFDLVLGE